MAGTPDRKAAFFAAVPEAWATPEEIADGIVAAPLRTGFLQVEDVAVVPGGPRLRIIRGKTDQAGQGAEIGLPRGRHVETCPLRAFEAWQAVAKRKAGPLFRKVSTAGGIGDTALHPDAVRRILAHRVQMAGLTVDGFDRQRARAARRLHHRRLRPGCSG
jgi:hypothetical protein